MDKNNNDKSYYQEFEGNCYTREMKYPIKVYYLFKGRSFEIPLPEGVELRKIIVGTITALLVMTIMVFAFVIGNEWVRNLILNRGIIITALLVFLAVFFVYQIDYGNKSIYRFYVDNISFMFTKNNRYEHYEKVNRNLENRKLEYSNFSIISSDKEVGKTNEKSDTTNKISD